MKLIILNDTHCGVRNSSEIFINYQERFYSEVFFPYCKEHDIKHVLHLGDYYDHRKNVNFKALNANRRMFLEPLRDNGMTMDILPGNHDVFHKNTNELCSLKELLGYYTSNVNIFMKPTMVDYDGTALNFLPWINSENYAESMDFIKNSKGTLLAHLELADFEMMRGIKQSSGMSATHFDHYDMVLSGHYHAKSTKGNINYLGCQIEFTWADAHDGKYFHVLDTKTGQLEAVLNPITIFQKVYYDDTDTNYDEYDITSLENKFVKVIVGNKSNPFMFDKFIDRIADINTHELKIAENFSEFLGENVETNLEDVENTTDLMHNYIDGVKTDLDKGKLKTLMNTLYNEALDMEIQ
jgi:DNA repair exonuclease SbcCD nuclease subunit